MGKYKYLLFDLDNTLINTDPFRVAALKGCGCHKPETIPIKELRNFSPKKIVIKYGGDFSHYLHHYRENIPLAKPILSDLPKVLGMIKQSNIFLGIVTSSPEKIGTAILKASGLIEFFPFIKGYSRTGGTKSKGHSLKSAMLQWHCDLKTTIYVGDSINDLKSSKVANINFAIASWGALSEDLQLCKEESVIVLSKSRDLLELI